jgi:hypothetical protein
MASQWLESLTPIASFLAGFITSAFAEPFRKWLVRPRLKLDFRHEFGEGTGYISRTPEREDSKEEAFYVRASVKNDSRTIAKNCRAYLLAIEREENPGQYRAIHQDPLPLDWAFIGPISMDLPPKVRFYFDVFSVSSFNVFVTPRTSPRAVTSPNSLSPVGRYRYTVTVAGESINPVPFQIEFDWGGSFEKFTPACFGFRG